MSQLELETYIESGVATNKRQKLDKPVTISDSEEESESEDDESIECTICSSNWKASGPHRLVSLKCGHLFGKSCIERWIDDRARKQGQNKGQCPICMETARVKDIRAIKCPRITALDDSMTNELLMEIEKEKLKLSENEHLLDNAVLALNLYKRELKKAKENINNNNVSQSDPSVSSQSKPKLSSSSQAATIEKSLFKSSKTSQISDKRQVYRVMEVCEDYDAVVLSYQSSNNTHGIRKVSLLDMDNPEFIPLHSKSIRDIKSSPHQPDLVLTTGLDKTMTITSLKSNSKLHSYTLNAPAWSCHVDQSNSNILYCGLVNSTVLVFDIRNSKSYIKSLSNTQSTSSSPLHSMQSIRIGDTKNALLCSNLKNTFLWKDPTSEDSVCTVLDVNTNGYYPFSVSSNTDNTFLLSSRKQNSTQHKVIKVSGDNDDDIINTETLFSFESPLSQISLCRTLSFIPNQNTQQETIVCYSQEEKNRLCLRNSMHEIQQFTLKQSLVDVKTFQNEVLLALTDNQLHIYNQ